MNFKYDKGEMTEMKKPRVSVIMPIYNAEKYVKGTIKQILNQTFKDFELVLINDHPTDKTMDIVRSIKDERIRIVENDHNRGIAYSRNRGLEEARGEYIALMDDDDLTDLERFKLEVEFLDKHPEIDVIGGGSLTINEKGEVISQPPFMLSDPGYVKAQMMFYCPMANSSVMFRKSMIDKYGIRYQDKCLGMEDYRFWIETSLHANIVNFQRTFLYWRVSETGETSRVLEDKLIERRKLFAQFQIYGLESHGFRLTDEEKKVFTDAFEETKSIIYKDLDKLYHVLKKLVAQAYELELPFADEMRYACRNRYLEMVRRYGQNYHIGMIDEAFSCQSVEAKKKVSVVIPTHNREDKITYSINSVLAQTYDNLEIIIVDDCSTDSTAEVVKRLQRLHKDKIFYYKMATNSGPAKARNFGVKQATGEYIAFHDDDDEWHPDKLEIQMTKMLRDTSIDMSFGQMSRYLNGAYVNTVCDRLDWYHMRENFFQELLLDNYVGAPTIVIKKDSFEKIKGFSERIPSLEDWEFAIRAARDLKVEFINTPLMDVHITRQSVTHNVEGYAKSWSYILEKYIEFAKDKNAFILQMYRHLGGALEGQETEDKERYVNMAKKLIVPKVIKEGSLEEKFFDMFFATKENTIIVNQDQHTVDRLSRYRRVCEKLLDPEDTIAKWLVEKKIKKVAIYGMGRLGKCLTDRLDGSGVKVVCGIDRNEASFRKISVMSMESFIKTKPLVDAVIITPLYEYDGLAKRIYDGTGNKYECISVEHLLQ